PDKTMIDMQEIYVNYNLGAIMGGKVYLPEVRLSLKEFFVIKNSKGELNLEALKPVQSKGKAPVKKDKAAGKAPEMKIDKLMLNIGKIVYKDYSKSTTPEVREFNVNLSETYTNIDNPYTLASLIVVKALIGTPVAALADFDIKGLQSSVSESMAGAKKAAAAAADKAQKAVSSTAEKAQETAGEATEKTKKTATEAVDKVKGLFNIGTDK
ncbi:MAG: hypothetical protein WCY05_07810, partial [Candidatus Omnitrophota bacterium]